MERRPHRSPRPAGVVRAASRLAPHTATGWVALALLATVVALVIAGAVAPSPY